ncbi:metal ABC transporter solute-binding protein, Zn/Mn family [Brevibacterium sp. UCMA 11754]|uniref:metal ABC transporter solute-binding protein, Zn/Mn family n=1 Tax=Brevibacterium sp. UCMA 11754 TaxID=2749198 RepID=UPI001F43CBBC|nr:zinc ABC transporter substrate-binding protein [Brevibacterium sp. UCMA 11754]MCF2571651.1 zinc ABC transporter substrate-binding protein [Brevibacterium sp. UCMA 11754]
MRSSLVGFISGAAALTTVAALSGCGGQASGSTDLSVVTSTNVYADIVSQVAGDFAKVSAVIDDPNQDPHSYEATTQDRLKLSKADLVVQNGGGYDSFMTTMLEASDVDVDTIDTVSISGLPGSEGVGNEGHDHGDEEARAGGHAHDHGEDEAHEHGEFNEHLWYSVPTMTKLVDEVATHLGEAEPEHKDDFAANADDYKKTLEKLQSQIDDAKAQHDGDEVAATEPVPLWLFEDMGLKNITSDEFLEAVEEGNDVPPLVLKKAEEQISSGEAVLLGYNTQAAGPQAEQLKSTAENSDVPVVDLGETMPADAHYADWMGDYITEISTALEGHEH